ncbi:hypothetical protein HXX76_005357 [Chlamydomonas incerta]|uniref:Uncharacterized protein n=1 Tax=Chlamydomonas incerta TaxID=51695 RepID=A0A835TI67_CHLIN|nr:hypothetical protein HXX76_005357 [Chlamydomonas incerta]|eukprot:KAG2438816.1 hypothetical protein HXX76_005357 [Chlamydomonas incerta]
MRVKAPAGPAAMAAATAATAGGVDADTDVCLSAGSACSSRRASSFSSLASSVGSLAASAKPHLRQSSRMRPPVAAASPSRAPESGRVSPERLQELAHESDGAVGGPGGGDPHTVQAFNVIGDEGDATAGRLEQLHAQDRHVRRLRGDSAALRVQPRSGSGSVRLARGAGHGGSRRMAFGGALQPAPLAMQPLPPSAPRPMAPAPAPTGLVGAAAGDGAGGASSAGNAMPLYLQLRQQRLRHEEPVSEVHEHTAHGEAGGGGGVQSRAARAGVEAATSQVAAEGACASTDLQHEEEELSIRLGHTDAPAAAPSGGAAASGGSATPVKAATLWRKIAGLIGAGGVQQAQLSPTKAPASPAAPTTPAQPPPAPAGARVMPSPPKQRPPGPHDSRLLHHKRIRRERNNPVLASAAVRALAAPPSPMPTTAWGDPVAAGRGEGGLAAAVLRLPPDDTASAAASPAQPGTPQQRQLEAKPRAPPPPPLALPTGEPRAPSALTSPVGVSGGALSSPGGGGGGTSILAGRSFQRRSNAVLPEPAADGPAASVAAAAVAAVPAAPAAPAASGPALVTSRSMPRAGAGELAPSTDSAEPVRLMQKSSSLARAADMAGTPVTAMASQGGREHADGAGTAPRGVGTAVAVEVWSAAAAATAAAMAPAELGELSLPGGIPGGGASLAQAHSAGVAPDFSAGGRADLWSMRSSPLDAAVDGHSSRGSCSSGPADASSTGRGPLTPSPHRSVSHGGNASGNGAGALGWWRRLGRAISHSGAVANLAAAPPPPQPLRASHNGALSATAPGPPGVHPQAGSPASPTQVAPASGPPSSPPALPAPPKPPRLAASPSLTRTSGSPPLLRPSESFGASLLATAASIGRGRGNASPAPHDSRIVHRRRIERERPPSMLAAAWAAQAAEADAAQPPAPASAAVSERASHSRHPSQQYPAPHAPHGTSVTPAPLQSPGASISGGRSIIAYRAHPLNTTGGGAAPEPRDRSSNGSAADAVGGLMFDMLHGEYGAPGLARVSRGLSAATTGASTSQDVTAAAALASGGAGAEAGAGAGAGTGFGESGRAGGPPVVLRRSAPGSLVAAAQSLRGPVGPTPVPAPAAVPSPAPHPGHPARGAVQQAGADAAGAAAEAAFGAGAPAGPPGTGWVLPHGGFRASVSASASGAELPLARVSGTGMAAGSEGGVPAMRVSADGLGGLGARALMRLRSLKTLLPVSSRS